MRKKRCCCGSRAWNRRGASFRSDRR